MVAHAPHRSALRSFIIWLKPTQLRLIVIAIIVLGLWGWFDVRARAFVDLNNTGAHKTDLTVYTEAGAAFFDGRDPYEVANVRGWTYLYPPLFALLLAPLHWLAPQTQAVVWYLLSLLAAWGSIRECIRIGRAVLPLDIDQGPFAPIATRFGSLAVLTVLFPALNCLQRGQVGVAKMYLLLLGFRLLVERRSLRSAALAGTVLALPMAVKLTPLLPVAVALASRFVANYYSRAPRHALGRTAVASGGVAFGLVLYLLLLPAALIGWSANWRHLGTWWNTIAVRGETSASEDFAGDSSSKRNQSFANGVRRLGNWTSYQFAGGVYDDDPRRLPEGSARPIMEAKLVDYLLLAGRIAAGLSLLFVAFVVARSGDRLGEVVVFGLACVATLVVSPIARGHYFVLMLPAAMFLPVWLVQQGRPKTAVWMAAIPAALSVGHYLFIDVLGRVGVLGIGTAIWFGAACWIVGRVTLATHADDVQVLPFAPREVMPAVNRRAA